MFHSLSSNLWFFLNVIYPSLPFSSLFHTHYTRQHVLELHVRYRNENLASRGWGVNGLHTWMATTPWSWNGQTDSQKQIEEYYLLRPGLPFFNPPHQLCRIHINLVRCLRLLTSHCCFFWTDLKTNLILWAKQLNHIEPMRCSIHRLPSGDRWSLQFCLRHGREV